LDSTCYWVALGICSTGQLKKWPKLEGVWQSLHFDFVHIGPTKR
jgi:hypothetical protein